MNSLKILGLYCTEMPRYRISTVDSILLLNVSLLLGDTNPIFLQRSLTTEVQSKVPL